MVGPPSDGNFIRGGFCYAALAKQEVGMSKKSPGSVAVA